MATPDLPIGPIVGAIAASLLGSLFASGDAALNSLPEARLQSLAAGDGPSATVFKRFASDRLRVLSRWLVGRVIMLALAAALLAHAAEVYFSATIGAVVAMVGTVITYGTAAEIMSTIARRRPEWLGSLALRFLIPLEWAVVPLAEPLAIIGQFFDRRFPKDTTVDARLTENEVEWVVAEGEKTGALAEEPAEMIRNVLDFKDLTAREVMVPRRKISAIELSTPLEKVIELVSTEGHSRYPVYRETLDNVVGLLYAKDLFDLIRDKQVEEKKLSDLVRSPVLFVVESQSAASVLREMRVRRLHMGIVSDEFGGTSGLVTLEDIIEEIVGEIHDEYDTDVEGPIEDLGDGRLVADASISLADLSTRLGQEFPADGDFESLGGLLVHRAGRVPAIGATLTLEGYKLIVREADETRVVKVEIVRTEPDEVPEVTAQVSS